MSSLSAERGRKTFGDGIRKLGGKQGDCRYSLGMVYEQESCARTQFELGVIDGFGFTMETGEFWMKRGDASAQAREYWSILERTWEILRLKDSRIQELETGSSQVGPDVPDTYAAEVSDFSGHEASWQEVMDLRKELTAYVLVTRLRALRCMF